MACEECRKRKVEEEQDMWAEFDYLEDMEPLERNMRTKYPHARSKRSVE